MKVTLASSDTLPRNILYNGKRRSYPVNIINDRSYVHTFDYQEKNVYEYVIKDATALSGSDTHHLFGIVKDKKYYFQDWAKGNKSAKTNSAFWKNLPVRQIGTEVDIDIDNKKIIEFNEPVNLFFSINAYWHWFMEDIPLIKFLNINNYKIITNKLTGWQKESLNFFPKLKQRIIEVETPCIIKSPEFHLFSKPDGGAGRNCKWVSEFLKEHFVPTEIFEPYRKIYISRNDAEARAVDNETELKTFLKTKGFEIYESFSQIGLQEKIDLFAQTKVVVSPTGANLCHVYAMPKNSCVIDFNHKFLLADEHWYNNIGSALGVNWTTIGAITGARNKRPRERNRNLILQLDLLEKVLV